jgi:uncharacterized protein
MTYVATKLGLSTIHGIGLFADELIPKGTVIWSFTPGFDLRFSDEDVRELPPQAQWHFDIYSSRSRQSGLRVLCVNNAKFFNHLDVPNTSSEYADAEEEVITRAIRDLTPGEELTGNYNTY